MAKKIMAVFLLCIVLMAALQFSAVYAVGEVGTGGADPTGTAGGTGPTGGPVTTGGAAAPVADAAGGTGTTGGAAAPVAGAAGGAGTAEDADTTSRPPKTMFSSLADKFRNMV